MVVTETIGLILLAAGGSSRLGRPKQLLDYQGQPLLRRAAETALASQCQPVIVVLGAEAGSLRRRVGGPAGASSLSTPIGGRACRVSIRAGLNTLIRKTRSSPPPFSPSPTSRISPRPCSIH